MDFPPRSIYPVDRMLSALSPARQTQRDRILSLLRSRDGAWVPLPEILDLHISQFGARIFELRRQGFVIENRTERDDSGAVLSYYRLVNGQQSVTSVDFQNRPRVTGLPLWDSAVRQ